MKQYSIKTVKAREIINGIGKPTIEVDVITEGNSFGRASVPSGTSKGKYEAAELRDKTKRYLGEGVNRAIYNINTTIADTIRGMEITNQNDIDHVLIELDGTQNKSRLGSNAILGVSLSVARAASSALKLPLYRYLGKLETYTIPTPVATVIAGGKHSGNKLDFEDYLIFPSVTSTFQEKTQAILEVFYELERSLRKRHGMVPMVGTGYAPQLLGTTDCLDMICESCKDAGYENCFALGLDAAASLFYDEESQSYAMSGKHLTSQELLKYYKKLVMGYPIQMIEDPFHEDDFEAFTEITNELDIQIVGDDLFATNRNRLEKGCKLKSANTLLLKLNQAGTLTEATEVAKFAFEKGYGIIVSVRSGETNDTFVADFAVGMGVKQMKLGVPCRGERSAKYNRLLRIQEEMQEI
jgi:enolase